MRIRIRHSSVTVVLTTDSVDHLDICGLNRRNCDHLRLNTTESLQNK